jgi:uncharacterized protein YPO0396
MFKTSFVASLNDKLGYIDDEIERLNYSLAQHRFHGERYRFKAMPAAETEELVDFVRRAANDDIMLSSLIDGEAPESNKNAALINRILFDESFDISRFDDYKEYMTFDLLMQSDELKTEVNLEGRRGIGSGAEKQVPFYVAIGAALAVAWHGGKDSKKNNPLGIGLAMFDEAFTKMDGGNQRACIDFFKGLGLQIVIAAPPEKQAIAGENLDSVIYVIKDGTRVEFIADVFKPKVKKAIEAANPRPTKEDARLSLEKQQRTEAAE